MTQHALCQADDIATGCARGFVIGEGKDRLEVVVVRTKDALRAYVNSCPHQSTPLETFPEKFLNEDGMLFVCSTHGARFRVEDGYCVSGPCEGKSLISIALDVMNGSIRIQV